MKSVFAENVFLCCRRKEGLRCWLPKSRSPVPWGVGARGDGQAVGRRRKCTRSLWTGGSGAATPHPLFPLPDLPPPPAVPRGCGGQSLGSAALEPALFPFSLEGVRF